MRERLKNSRTEPDTRTLASLSVAELVEHVGDPDVYSGGGTIAALVGASAVGVALLVMRLSARRKSIEPESRELIDHDIRVTQDLAHELQSAADRDVQVLEQLMVDYAVRKTEAGRERYQARLHTAAASTLDIAGLIVALLEIVDRQVAHASRFVVSDLGAAAEIAGGAGRAALITARINIELLDPAGPVGEVIPELRSRFEALSQRIDRLVHRTASATEAAMTGSHSGKGP